MAFRSLGTVSKAVVFGTAGLTAGALGYFWFKPYHTDMYKTIMDIDEVPKYLAARFAADFDTLQKQTDSKSLLKRHLTKSVFDSLYQKRTARNVTLHDIIQSGLENPESKIGVYAAEASSYTDFANLFDPIINDLHGRVKKQPASDWGRTNLAYFDKNLDPDRKYIKKTRIECRRNMAGMMFHPHMRLDDYYYLESKFKSGFLKKTSDEDLTGKYISMKAMKSDEKVMLDETKIDFPTGDKFLKSAKVYQHWPNGRAIFYNNYKGASLTGYINVDDHLKLISEVQGGDVKTAFDRLGRCVKNLEAQIDFARTNELGFLTFSPEYLGSAVRATVEISLPSAQDSKDFEEKCANLNLKCQDGAKGVKLVSNKQTMNMSEFDSVKQLYDGVKSLIENEEGGGKKDRN